MKIRINNLEFKEYTSTKKDKPLYEIVKWFEEINVIPYCIVIAFIEKGSEDWGDDVIVGDRTVDVHVRRIKIALNNECIRGVKGIGYKWN